MTEIESDARTTVADDCTAGGAGGGDAAGQNAGAIASVQTDEAPAQSAAATQSHPIGFGHALAHARERLGVSVADMAARLRLHPRQVAALEDEQLASLPEAPFVRGFVRNYAKELQIDPAPLLADLAARLPSPRSLGDPLPEAGTSRANTRRPGVDGRSRIAVIGGAVIALVVLGLIGWLTSVGAPTVASTAAPISDPAVNSRSADSAPAPSAAPSGASEAGAVPTPVAPSNSGDASSTDAPVMTPGVSPQDSTRSQAPAEAVVPVSFSGVRLQIGDRPSWIEVTQADGAVILSGLHEPGTERRLAPVRPPLRLVIGNSSAVRLEYRGKVIDLKAHARADDLARLTLE